MDNDREFEKFDREILKDTPINYDQWQDPILGARYVDNFVQNRYGYYQAAISHSKERIEALAEIVDEQKGAIRALNLCIGGEDSLTTNNLRACDRFLDNEKCLLERIAELGLPKDPPIGLLISMAIRYDHGLAIPNYYDDMPIQFGQTHKQRFDSAISLMRQLYEEVSGNGFYKADKESEYLAMTPNNQIKALR